MNNDIPPFSPHENLCVEDIKEIMFSSLNETELRPEDLESCVEAFPPAVRDTLKVDVCCVAGGFIRDTVLHDAPKDIDIFTTSEVAARDIARRLFDRAPYARLGWAGKHLIETGKALTIVNGYKGPAPQVIFKWVFPGGMDRVIDAFDFTIAQAAIWWDGQKFVSRCAPTFYTDIESQELVYNSPEHKDTLGSMLRVMKFYRAGYSINNEHLSKVLAEICTEFSRMDFSGGAPFDFHTAIKTRLPNRGDGKY